MQKRLEKLSTKITFTDNGLDENYGARPLHRAIQSKIEDVLSEKMLEGSVKENSTVVCSPSNGKFTFEEC